MPDGVYIRVSWECMGLSRPRAPPTTVRDTGSRTIFLNPDTCICIYHGMSKPATFALSCMCASFRRASRVLTQHYDTALRPLGLRATQFTLLQALTQAGEVSQRTLGEILAIDSTTLTRTLAIMGRRGWIAIRSGEDAPLYNVRYQRPGPRACGRRKTCPQCRSAVFVYSPPPAARHPGNLAATDRRYSRVTTSP